MSGATKAYPLMPNSPASTPTTPTIYTQTFDRAF